MNLVMHFRMPNRLKSLSAVYLFVLAIGLIVRLYALSYAYPAPWEVIHVVQVAVERANGNADAWNPVYSVGAQLVGTLAEEKGVSSLFVLQGLSVVSGTLLVGATALVAQLLMKNKIAVVVTGLFVATNPLLIYYSCNGFTEIPYSLFLMLAMATFLYFRCQFSRVSIVLTYIFLGIAAYFRFDEVVYLSAITTITFLIFLIFNKKYKRIWYVIAGVSLLALQLAPISFITYKQTGSYKPHVKTYAFAIRDSFDDSKEFNSINSSWKEEVAVLKQKGLIPYLYGNKTVIIKRWVKNALKIARLLNSNMLVGMFRIGLAWFLFLCALMIYRLFRARLLCGFLPLIVLVVFQLSLVAFFAAFPRYIVPSLPFIGVCFSCALCHEVNKVKKYGIIFSVIVAVFSVSTTVYAIESLREKDIPFWHAKVVGEKLREHGDEEDVIMSQNFSVSFHYYKKHPLRCVRMLYGSLEETEEYAKKNNVTLIAVTDGFYGHWPVGDLLRGTNAPDNWVFLDEIQFVENTRWGECVEKYKLFRRQ